jgi:hypothetical protein
MDSIYEWLTQEAVEEVVRSEMEWVAEDAEEQEVRDAAAIIMRFYSVPE